MRLLLRRGHLLTMDPDLGERPGTDLAVSDGVITAIGHDLDPTGAEVIDVGGRVVLPGLVDAHRHVWQAPLRGVAADLSLSGYVPEMLGRISPRYSPEDLRRSTLFGAVEAIETGVTTVFDWATTRSSDHVRASVEGFREAGIRAVFAHGRPDDEADVGALAGQCSGLVTLAVATGGPEYLPFEDAARHIALGRRHGLMVSMHVGGGTTGGSARSVARLAEAGLLGPDLQFVHGNLVSDGELAAVVHSGAHLVVTPAVESMMGHGASAYGRFRAAGGHPALGVDVGSVTGPDLFAQLRAALWHERGRSNQATLDSGRDPDRVSPPAGAFLRAVTIDGARAVGLADRVGSLTVGKRADIIVLGGASHLVGGSGVASAVVATLGPQDVEAVLVDGEFVKRDGRLVRHDRARLRSDVDEIARRVLA